MGNSMFKKPSLKGKPVIVIIGGGYAGTQCALGLDKEFNVILINRTEYFFHNVGAPRAVVHPETCDSYLIPYDKMLKNGEVIQAQVESITKEGLKVRGSDEIIQGYKYLIIATGTSYAFPFKCAPPSRKDVQPLYQAVADKIKEAKNIIVCGGGSTGLETAAEIAEAYPDTVKVFLVHSHAQVMMPGPWKASFIKKLTKQLGTYKNLELVMEDRIDEPEEEEVLDSDGMVARKFSIPTSGKVTTRKGRDLPCDLLFWCIGGRINSKSYEETLPIDEKSKCIKVNKYLQVEDMPHVYAVGDCADSGAAKTVNFAHQTADSVVANIKRIEAGKTPKPFAKGPDLNITQLGHKLGAAQIPPLGGTVLGAGFTQSVKADMFVGKFWKDFGYKKTPRSGTAIDDVRADVDEQKLADLLNMTPETSAKFAAGFSSEPQAEENT